MKFESDPGKNEINRAKHGLDLDEARVMWAVRGVEVDIGIVNGEYRYARLAPIDGVIHVVFFTYRHGPTIRSISFRVANENEIAIYEKRSKK